MEKILYIKKSTWLAFFVSLIATFLMTAVTHAGTTGGFDEFGYNETARNFVGTGSSWCQGKLHKSKAYCDTYMGVYADDKLVMKWNAEWDRGNDEGWSDPNGYAAWTDNEWNGRANGSGEIWHYKIAWDRGCALNKIPSGTAAKGGAYCLWGPFAMLQSQGSGADKVHYWDVLLKPAGYGAY
ncbi:MAG: hypothetical protein NUV73_02065 [Candidatus Daviesbacteria bacterium]|nr:hypothetical protein [Candidatus Daviesbacteria bacterium]